MVAQPPVVEAARSSRGTLSLEMALEIPAGELLGPRDGPEPRWREAPWPFLLASPQPYRLPWPNRLARRLGPALRVKAPPVWLGTAPPNVGS